MASLPLSSTELDRFNRIVSGSLLWNLEAHGEDYLAKKTAGLDGMRPAVQTLRKAEFEYLCLLDIVNELDAQMELYAHKVTDGETSSISDLAEHANFDVREDCRILLITSEHFAAVRAALYGKIASAKIQLEDPFWPIPGYAEMGIILRQLRMELGYPQSKLSADLRVSQAQISNVEQHRGGRKVPIDLFTAWISSLTFEVGLVFRDVGGPGGEPQPSHDTRRSALADRFSNLVDGASFKELDFLEQLMTRLVIAGE